MWHTSPPVILFAVAGADHPTETSAHSGTGYHPFRRSFEDSCASLAYSGENLPTPDTESSSRRLQHVKGKSNIAKRMATNKGTRYAEVITVLQRVIQGYSKRTLCRFLLPELQKACVLQPRLTVPTLQTRVELS